jgi:hypothetical protein
LALCRAFIAAAWRAAGLRLLAAVRAFREIERRFAAERRSLRRAIFVALDLRAEGRRVRRRESCFAFLRVDALAPRPGGFSFTPARRASESPMAIACFVERAPCLPRRMCSISWRTNSPACVEGDFPSAASFRARASVRFSGMRDTSCAGTYARRSSIETGGPLKRPRIHNRQ